MPGAAAVAVQGGALVRILAIAQRHGLRIGQPQGCGKGLLAGLGRDDGCGCFWGNRRQRLQRIRNRQIVGSGQRKRLLCQSPARRATQLTLVRLQFFRQCGIVRDGSHDGNILKVFCRGAHHRRAADIDVLNDLREVDAGLVQRRFKGVEIYHHHIDGLDAMLRHRFLVFRIGADVENAAVYLGMQRLYATIQHLGKSRQLGNIQHRQSSFAQGAGGSAGRHQFGAIFR